APTAAPPASAPAEPPGATSPTGPPRSRPPAGRPRTAAPPRRPAPPRTPPAATTGAAAATAARSPSGPEGIPTSPHPTPPQAPRTTSRSLLVVVQVLGRVLRDSQIFVNTPGDDPNTPGRGPLPLPSPAPLPSVDEDPTRRRVGVELLQPGLGVRQVVAHGLQ